MKSVIAVGIALGLALGGTYMTAQSNQMSFFITSTGMGDGANLGGLAGADKHCQTLAAAAGAGNRTWRAYLSTQGGGKPVNARDRIGKGPWQNAKGVVVAQNVEDLHSANNKLSKENSLTEKGGTVNGRGDTPNTHDILTGSMANGTAFTDGVDHTCSDWTSNAATSAEKPAGAAVGHHDRQGGGQDPTSWNSAHTTPGCGQANLAKVGGAGLFMCFAAN
jgi:hypothetical protein